MPRTRPPRKGTGKLAAKTLEQYLVCCYFDEYGDEDRDGHFEIVVQAHAPDDAVDRCRALLEKLRRHSTLFAGPTSIFIGGVIRLRGSLEEGLLVNYEAFLGREERPSIWCLIPEQGHDESEGYGWSPLSSGKRGKKPKHDEPEPMAPFLDFGGQAVLAMREKRERQAAVPDASDWQRESDARVKRMEADKQIAARKAEKAAQERKRALAETLRELRSGPPAGGKTRAR